jgi:hypothetical protein
VSKFPGWSVEQQEAYYMDFDPATHWIVVTDGEDVGDMSIVRTDQYIDYRGLHLLPDHPKGLGTKVSEDLFREADEKGLPVLGRCIKANVGALKLWQRLGYVITGEKENQYTMVRPCSGHAPGEVRADLNFPPGKVLRAEEVAPARRVAKGPGEVKRKPIDLEM